SSPLIIRKEKVRSALIWLHHHNPLYKDVVIDHDEIDKYPECDMLPVHVEHITSNDSIDNLTSGYQPQAPVSNSEEGPQSGEFDLRLPFENIVVTNVDGNASTNELRTAAMRHFKEKEKGYVQIPHAADPVNEFSNPDLFPMIYPTLFPYGLGGPENCKRSCRLSFKRNIKHL
ncbi:hypothetical protein BDZ97DRAFT_1641378, partial [Flammula alnicola]